MFGLKAYGHSTLVAVSVASLLMAFSCQNKKQRELSQHRIKEPLMDANKQYVQQESMQIDAFVSRRDWKVNRTGTGLRYLIYEQGDTTLPKAREGQRALVEFEVSLLNGKVCYTTEGSGPQEFLIGMDDVESGLHEGIRYLRVGDKAKLILPSHLAHGLLGDRDKIPLRSTVIYDIHLIGLR